MKKATVSCTTCNGNFCSKCARRHDHNGKYCTFILLEKGGYTPKRRYSNKWIFADLSTDISKQIYECGQGYLFNARKGHNIFSYPAQLTRFFYFLGMTGARLKEPVDPPVKIVISNANHETTVTIDKLSEKHKGPNGGKKIITQVLPVFNEWERKMWMYITDGGMLQRGEDIFLFKEWNSLKKNNLNQLIKHNFRINLRDLDDVVHRQHGITPHILRHMRAFSMLQYTRGRTDLVLTWMDWKDVKMLLYYAQLARLMTTQNQLKALRDDKLLTDMPIVATGID
jgi:integrase